MLADKTKFYARAIFWIVLASIGSIAFFWKGFEALFVAWARPEYSYGPLVPVITAYMTLREIKRHPVRVSNDSRIPGALVVIFGMMIGLLGNLSEIPDFVTYGFIVVVGGLVLVMAGKQGYRFWPGWLHLFFHDSPAQHSVLARIDNAAIYFLASGCCLHQGRWCAGVAGWQRH